MKNIKIETSVRYSNKTKLMIIELFGSKRSIWYELRIIQTPELSFFVISRTGQLEFENLEWAMDYAEKLLLLNI